MQLGDSEQTVLPEGQFADFHSSPLEEERRKPRLKAIACIWSELWDGKQPKHFFFLGVFYIQSGGCIIYHSNWDTFESERGVLLIMTLGQQA